jgi:hypothetical protein
MNMVKWHNYLIITYLAILTISCSDTLTLDTEIDSIVKDVKQKIESSKYPYNDYTICVESFPVYKNSVKSTEKEVKAISNKTKKLFHENILRIFNDIKTVKVSDFEGTKGRCNSVIKGNLTVYGTDYLEITATFERIDTQDIISTSTKTISLKNISKNPKINQKYREALDKPEHLVNSSYGAALTDLERTSQYIGESYHNIIVKERGEDTYKNFAEFYVIAYEFEWKFESTEEFQSDENIMKHLSLDVIERELKGVTDIICVGTASCEKNDLELEENRAEKRAIRIAHWLNKKYLNGETNIYTLNLGIYKDGECSKYNSTSETSPQRKALIIGVKKKTKSVILKEAIWNGLQKVKISNFSLLNYSNSDKDKFKLDEYNQ